MSVLEAVVERPAFGCGGIGGACSELADLLDTALLIRSVIPYFWFNPVIFCFPDSIWSLCLDRKSLSADLAFATLGVELVGCAGGGRGPGDGADAELVLICANRLCISFTGAWFAWPPDGEVGFEDPAPIPSDGTETPAWLRRDVAAWFTYPSEVCDCSVADGLGEYAGGGEGE